MKRASLLWSIVVICAHFTRAQSPDDDQHVLTALRARITGGAIFFNGAPEIVLSADKTTASFQSAQFSQASTYLAFESQPRLAAFGEQITVPSVPAAAGAPPPSPSAFSRWYVDPFVNVRLTSIPVAGSVPDTQAQPIQAPTAAFLQSQKAAQIQFGLVTSWNFRGFQLDGANFHWGIGPVIRQMYQSVTDGQRAFRVWDIDDDLFDAETAGVRLSLYQEDSKLKTAPPTHRWKPAAYGDFSVGHFQNFDTASGNTDAARQCLLKPSSCLATGVPPKADFTRQHRIRFYAEGRVFLKFLYLGFDLNDGEGPDDLRFIGGVTVELDRFLKSQ